MPPIGALPSVGVLFIGGLLYASPAQAATVLAVVRDDDMATPSLSILLAAVRRLVAAGTPPSPQLVFGEIRREGTLKHFAVKALQDATTAGAQPMALREYGAAALAESLRRKIHSVGTMLTEAADVEGEENLARLVDRGLASIVDCAGRLDELRDDHG